MDKSGVLGHKLELIRLTHSELNSVINTARENQIKRFTTAVDNDRIDEFIQINDETFRQFGGRIHLTYAEKKAIVRYIVLKRHLLLR